MATLGADPEVFAVDSTGRYVPLCGKIGGTKKKPLPISDGSTTLPAGYTVQEDNVMLEFNIPPVENPNAFNSAIKTALEVLEERYLQPLGLTMSHETSALFSAEDLDSPQAATFGCSPDFDGYNNGMAYPRVNPKELMTAAKSDGWRFAGGHLHLGFETSPPAPPFVLASFADVFIGLQAVSHSESQGMRRKLYGQAGRYRPTSYGIEYRTLGNYWLWHGSYRKHVAQCAFKLMSYIDGRGSADIRKHFMLIPWVDVRRAINTEDSHLASSLYEYILCEVMK